MAFRFLACIVLGIAFAGTAAAQYPNRSIRILPNAAAGTGPDVLSRLLAAKLQESTGVAVVVENRPGANGNLAGEVVARAAPDGYTLLIATDAQLTINPHVY